MPEKSVVRVGLRKWLAVVVVIVALVLALGAADHLVRGSAENLVARDVQSATGSNELPLVEIGGGFLLAQVVRGAYQEVDLHARDLRDGPLRIDRVDARLSDVRVPFHDVLVRNVRTIGVGHSETTVRLGYPAINDYLAATGRNLTVAPASGDQSLRVTGTVQVLNRRLQASAVVRLAVGDGNLRLTPQAVSSDGGTLGATARLLLQQRLTLTIPLGALPFSQRLTAVTATADGLVISAVGDNIVMQP